MTVRVLGHDPMVETVMAPGPVGALGIAGFRGICSCEWSGKLQEAPSPQGSDLAAADALEHVVGAVRYRYRGRPFFPDRDRARDLDPR